ncbi:MAG: winged helix-turn-helix domain-containing protein [Steroidobacteraceae bacterium]
MSDIVDFDRFRFEPRTGRLSAAGQEVRLTPKAAALLGALVERAGQPVTKQELFTTVWSGTVVSDDALVTCIQELRKALGDDAKHPRFIETRHRSGYRFVAGLSRPDLAAAPSAIAVLPFTDLSPERDQGHFCDGLAEELIDALTHVEGLRVVARSSSFQFRGDALDVSDIGRRLRVGSLLEGSVRKEGGRLRITVQLIEVASGFHQWSQSFDRDLGDLFAVQQEIAGTVATQLRGGRLTERELRGVWRQPTAFETYEFFLRGRQSLHGMQRPDLEHSRRMFEAAIALDAGYAPAWAGLATVHATLYEWHGATDEDLRQAIKASEITMQLAPELADAHVARGFALSLQRHYAEALRHFESAARINPQLFDAYYYGGRTSFASGDIARSAELFGRAAEVRKEDFQSAMLQSQSLRMIGRLEEAVAANREGIARAERMLALNPVDGRALALGSVSLYELGETARAMQWSRRSLELYADDMNTLINAACVRSKAGLKEEALALLERAFSRGWGKRDWIEQDHDYDLLRADPRFHRLLEKLK